MIKTPAIFGNYKLLEEIGKGGMARVYRAHQLNIERDVAVKVLSSAISDQEEFKVRFKREADLFARLEHPNILPIYDYGSQDNYLYLVLRMMEGGTLERWMRGKQLVLSELERLVAQVASALDYAHVSNVVHRDLKPNNILLDNFGNAYLMDFGIAKIVSEAQSGAISTMLGTPAYMAPEQWRMEPIDGRIDVYGLGVIIYEMLTGEMPFVGETPYHLMYAHLHDEPRLPSALFPGLSSEIDAVVLRALAKDREARYQSAGELANEFSKAIELQERDTRDNPTSLKNSIVFGQDTTISVDNKPDVLGSILLALDRPNNRVYAMPKVEDFIDVVGGDRPKPDASKRFVSWSMDDILQELEAPSRKQISTINLSKMFGGGGHQVPSLGVNCYPVRLPESLAAQTEQTHGLLIAEVNPESIAARIGLILGDTLLAIDNKRLKNQDDLNDYMAAHRSSDAVKMRFIRAGNIQDEMVQLSP